MLGGPLVFRRPDLRGEICSLIGLVCHGHVDGELLVPVGALVQMLGVSVAPDFRIQLDARGDLHFSGERFRNAGPVINREVRLMGMGMSLEIASPLTGTIHRQHDRFRLDFDPGASFGVGRFVFETELSRLAIDPDRVQAQFRTGPPVRIELTEA